MSVAAPTSAPDPFADDIGGDPPCWAHLFDTDDSDEQRPCAGAAADGAEVGSGGAS